MSISIDKLSDVLAEELSHYSKEVNDAVHEEVKSVTKQCVNNIRNNAPEDTGAYKKSWTSKVNYENDKDIKTTVYAKAPYHTLTHLLENGHAKVGGGRVKAYPHIAPAEEKAAKTLEDRVKVRIGGI